MIELTYPWDHSEPCSGLLHRDYQYWITRKGSMVFQDQSYDRSRNSICQGTNAFDSMGCMRSRSMRWAGKENIKMHHHNEHPRLVPRLAKDSLREGQFLEQLRLAKLRSVSPHRPKSTETRSRFKKHHSTRLQGQNDCFPGIERSQIRRFDYTASIRLWKV